MATCVKDYCYNCDCPYRIRSLCLVLWCKIDGLVMYIRSLDVDAVDQRRFDESVSLHRLNQYSVCKLQYRTIPGIDLGGLFLFCSPRCNI